LFETQVEVIEREVIDDNGRDKNKISNNHPKPDNIDEDT